MSVAHVNCHASYRYAVRVRIPNDRNVLAAPAAGVITGITLRLAATEIGDALDPAVDDMTATEADDAPGTFYVEVTQDLHETHVLPLGTGTSYYAIWSKASEFDFKTRRFIVSDRDRL